MESTPNQKLKLRIGENEFEAEGPPDQVAAQYQAFLEAIKAIQSVAPAAPAKPSPNAANGADITETKAEDRTPSAITPEILARVFQVRGDSLSLLALPQDPADALIVLLYGYGQLKQVPNVTGVSLMSAALQSGVQLPRVDRVIDSKAEYITSGGAKRGKRYGLNNRGLRYAEDLVAKLVQ
jgi:hypothetical protein